ncbi:MAG: hypothetical protein ABIX12_02890 [Rubrivivax sp.]
MTLTVRTAQMQEMADARPGQPMVQACARDAAWIEFKLVDKKGAPIPGEPYRVRLPDQSLQTGRLDRDGKVRFDGILPGEAVISFPGIDGEEWWPLGDAPPPPAPSPPAG